MNDVDRLLVATADFLEAEIAANPDLERDLRLLFEADQHPSITRVLKGFVHAEAVIVLGRPA
jgi:hypothetical protein